MADEQQNWQSATVWKVYKKVKNYEYHEATETCLGLDL
jgi:hypothetical protein